MERRTRRQWGAAGAEASARDSKAGVTHRTSKQEDSDGTRACEEPIRSSPPPGLCRSWNADDDAVAILRREPVGDASTPCMPVDERDCCRLRSAGEARAACGDPPGEPCARSLPDGIVACLRMPGDPSAPVAPRLRLVGDCAAAHGVSSDCKPSAASGSTRPGAPEMQTRAVAGELRSAQARSSNQWSPTSQSRQTGRHCPGAVSQGSQRRKHERRCY